MCNVNTKTSILVHNEFLIVKFLHIFNPIVDPSEYKYVQLNEKKRKPNNNKNTRTYTIFLSFFFFHYTTNLSAFFSSHIYISPLSIVHKHSLALINTMCAGWWRKKKCVVMSAYKEKRKKNDARERLLFYFFYTHTKATLTMVKHWKLCFLLTKNQKKNNHMFPFFIYRFIYYDHCLFIRKFSNQSIWIM